MKKIKLKKNSIASLLLITMFFSCVNHISEEDTQSTNLSIVINGYEQTFFDDPTRSTAADAFSRLTVCVFAKGEKTQEIKQISTEKDFGNVNLVIPYGEHQLVIVGHNSTGEAIVTSPTAISFIDDRITDTFHYYEAITVDKNTPEDLNVVLNRSVAKFELVATDIIPSDAKELHFTITGAGKALNSVTGMASETVKQEKTISIPSSYLNTKNNTFMFYSFLPENETEIEVIASARNTSDVSFQEETFTKIPMKVNRITRYTGEFFRNGASVTGNITVNNTWENNLEVGF